ncbi:hypothetical protein PF005_g24248 [Phytophthora fragariae]|uniref:Uncharacterized protein n=1 Tax=Phytophthora fragariae TaxID=53985 RepID=A0A6A3II44_9STRA|nr:hypothetical protein PF003_g24283 [Phytophthora fragariae]KAE8981657.1 hypothetical protein PF011_g21936 [Phytophthora fragariae]KAE9094506.1 hypothetical protein PF006_g24204 [Phytophthora fragariae]KAE9178047.1 hypothetical protein PF005_g24248 [Phytophthora fragariae]
MTSSLVEISRPTTTDNDHVMLSVWEILERGRPLCCNGRSIHALNHILEEVLLIPWLSWALSRSVTLSKFVRNRPQLLARYRNFQKAKDKEAPR